MRRTRSARDLEGIRGRRIWNPTFWFLERQLGEGFRGRPTGCRRKWRTALLRDRISKIATWVGLAGRWRAKRLCSRRFGGRLDKCSPKKPFTGAFREPVAGP